MRALFDVALFDRLELQISLQHCTKAPLANL
jgi:hypothetical protein